MQRARSRLTFAVAALALSASVLVAARAKAQSDAEKARRAQVAVHFGSHSMTVGELEDRLAKVPRYQLASFGNDPASIRQAFIDRVIAPDMYLTLAAETQHVDQRLTVQQALARGRAEATKRAVRAQAEARPVTADDVQKYYDDHRALYDAPERYGVWRILCKTREEAVSVLEAAKKTPTPEKFTELARDHSLDQATKLRGGNLGFVTLDGTSNEQGFKVDLNVVKAAAAVKDGEFAPTPIEEGSSGFAVVWHRGTAGASKRSLQQVEGQIRDSIAKNRSDEALKSLSADLRKNVTEENDQLLKSVDISQADGTIAPRRKAGQVPALKSSF
ncbi:MAG TPA: peptidyl-prolyl cis-trans isomerase [Polyangiaceae bacterium]